MLGAMDSALRPFVSGLAFPEAPRWHGGALWFSDFYLHRVLRATPDGQVEAVAELPDDQPSGLGWLPGGQLLVVGMKKRRVLRIDGSRMQLHADLSSCAPAPCNDMLVDAHGRPPARRRRDISRRLRLDGGGRAMELMMKQGIIGAVFDYAMGEISDALFHGLRAGDADRLTVAGDLGLPQVIVPGGAEHLGILVSTPHVLPDRWKTHKHVWHNEVVLAPRLNDRELRQVAREAGRRLQHTRGNAVLMIPTLGTGRYAMPGGPLNDPAGDAVFFEALKAAVPPTIEVVERARHAEDPVFVDEAVDRLIGLIERR